VVEEIVIIYYCGGTAGGMRSWALYLKGIVDKALTEGWILQLSNSSGVGGRGRI